MSNASAVMVDGGACAPARHLPRLWFAVPDGSSPHADAPCDEGAVLTQGHRIFDLAGSLKTAVVDPLSGRFGY